PVLAFVFLGCGGKSEIPADTCDLSADGADVPTCIAAADGDPCGPLHVVQAVCDQATSAYRCPEGAWPYARAADAPETCLPFADLAGSGQSLQAWGIGGSLVPVSTDDGRCLWVADGIQMPGGAAIRNAAFEVDRRAPFGSCPGATLAAGGASIVEME